jgi:hypothetical protein
MQSTLRFPSNNQILGFFIKKNVGLPLSSVWRYISLLHLTACRHIPIT